MSDFSTCDLCDAHAEELQVAVLGLGVRALVKAVPM